VDGDAVVTHSTSDMVEAAPGHAFELFYRQEHPVCLALVLALRGPRVGAEEVVQEAFLRAYRDWSVVAVADVPAYWVRRVALNLATSRWRRIGAEARAVARLAVRSQDGAEGGFERVDAADRFWRAVRRLPAQQREVVALRYAADLPVDGVAAVLGKAPGTVRATLHAARQRLAVLLQTDRVEP
jgi:RNA polymerase sigma-70 factor, ECF subfamily